ncbi:MAG: cyclic pyranopterin phosphate synthase MoaA [Spirochaetes bacterium RBG_16_49_21]|nr:MAG: cyclic pyranopterin phosphate synthase MoaA [Spirochaetes bacterium RBG_16_49_21]
MEKNMNKINYLRLSVTDRCNLNCIYCNPAEKEKFLHKSEILSYEEMARITKIFSMLGVNKVRITGGEPLIKKEIVKFVGMLRDIKAIDEISMTTNGTHLKKLAKDLKHAGLDRINISLDTLQAERFEKITGTDGFHDVWDGITASMEAGLSPTKLNVILMKGINDDEVDDFIDLTFRYPLIVRFIEYFPTNRRLKEYSGNTITNEKVKGVIINAYGELKEGRDVIGNGPARYYQVNGAVGAVGFISSFSDNFCSACNRIRIDSSGMIYPCLFTKEGYAVRHLLKENVSDEVLLQFITGVIREKPLHNKKNECEPKVEMSSVGG